MGNRVCCGGSWSCPSTFQKKKKTGSQARRTLKPQPRQLQQNGPKGHETTGHTYERVLQQQGSQERSPGLMWEDSNLHYADIEVCSRPHSWEVKQVHLEDATEYATLRFPQATPRYDSKNGTLV
ncbi:uncharacterized protein C11orf52 homolog [Piliocolobus tephrosceles]|uniref:Uncharacterized protein n=1 Tax=Piliocolobus tephrosceles TaxID=591936 RepID=A0A8C9HWP6_9PRIM|nr:uncharacterized protein C11orf52 homolog [Piliocolobus tephrosceles]